MDTPDTALRGQNTTASGRLYMAFELGEKNGYKRKRGSKVHIAVDSF